MLTRSIVSQSPERVLALKSILAAHGCAKLVSCYLIRTIQQIQPEDFYNIAGMTYEAGVFTQQEYPAEGYCDSSV